MEKSSEEEHQRFPNLSNLSIAILEHLVESTLGKSAIDEVKKPYAEKQIFDSLGQALTQVVFLIVLIHDPGQVHNYELRVCHHSVQGTRVGRIRTDTDRSTKRASPQCAKSRQLRAA